MKVKELVNKKILHRYMADGYWRIKLPEHPAANKMGYIYEHRWILEKHLGRFLEPTEISHHINKVTSDNRIENLELMTLAGHISHHRQEAVSGRICSSCGTTETHWDKNKQCYCWGFTLDKKVLCLVCHRKYIRQIRGDRIRQQRRDEYRRHRQKYLDREKERRVSKRYH